jgi:threonine 3-dehydrogenase
VLRGAVANIVTDTLPASRWQDGFDTARRGASGKVVLDWTSL